MEAFIEGVRLQPCLWNPLHPDYREMHTKDESWQRVVAHYNNVAIPNIQIAKIEWKKLRDNHRDALKRAKLGKNKLLPAQITTWKYAKAMQFLEPHMKYRITENIEIEPPSTSTLKKSEQDVSTTESGEVAPSTIPSKHRCECRNESRHDSDALESFFNCILQSTRTMPLWMQTQVKKKIFAVIINAEEHLSGHERDETDRSWPDQVITDTHGFGEPSEKKIKTEMYADTSCDNECS